MNRLPNPEKPAEPVPPHTAGGEPGFKADALPSPGGEGLGLGLSPGVWREVEEEVRGVVDVLRFALLNVREAAAEAQGRAAGYMARGCMALAGVYEAEAFELERIASRIRYAENLLRSTLRSIRRGGYPEGLGRAAETLLTLGMDSQARRLFKLESRLRKALHRSPTPTP